MSEIQPAHVKAYWEKVAEQFDTIYSGEKSGFMRFLDKVFRRDMYERYHLTISECADPAIKSVLDVGTGSGRFCLPLADQKEKIVGIDFSAPMIELAQRRAQEAGVADRCDFRVGDFMDMDISESFDVVIAIGVFDYVSEPATLLRKMRKQAGAKIVTTFPTLWTWRVVPRWIRLKFGGCPVYFFTKDQVRKYHEAAGLTIKTFKRVGKIYFVVAKP